MGVRVKVGASPGYPPRLQVARGVSPALPHGRVGPPSPTRSFALPLLRVLLTVLGVPLPEGCGGITEELALAWLPVPGDGSLSVPKSLHPSGAGDRICRGRGGASGREGS